MLALFILGTQGEMVSFGICELHGPIRTFAIHIAPDIPVSILHKSTAGRYRPVRVADGPITARCRFI